MKIEKVRLNWEKNICGIKLFLPYFPCNFMLMSAHKCSCYFVQRPGLCMGRQSELTGKLELDRLNNTAASYCVTKAEIT